MIPNRARTKERGLSLLEVLFAGMLVATVAVFLAPFFVKAVAANTQGGESSQATNHSKSFLEASLAVPLNHQNLFQDGSGDGGPPGPPAGGGLCPPSARNEQARFRRVARMVYDRGPQGSSGLDAFQGDEGWRPADPNGADDPPDPTRLWDADIEVRDFSYFDLLGALISALDSDVLYTESAGAPYVLDCPLAGNAGTSARHLKEMTTEVRSRREGSHSSFHRTGAVNETRQIRAF